MGDYGPIFKGFQGFSKGRSALFATKWPHRQALPLGEEENPLTLLPGSSHGICDATK